MHALLNQAREEKGSHVWGEYKPSPKNGIVKHFFTQHGFELAGMDGNTQLFRHDLAYWELPRLDCVAYQA